MKKKVVSVVALLLLAAMFAVVLTACVPKDATAAKAKMKDAGYLAIGFDYKGAEGTVLATKLTETVYAVWYKDSSSAKEAYEDFKTFVEKTLGGSLKSDNFVIKRSGNCIYAGTTEAAKAFAK